MSAVILGMVIAQSAGAYPVGPAASLEELYEQADLICKVKAVSTEPAPDPWFQEYRGFQACATRLGLISIIKGGVETRTIIFRHYGQRKGMGIEFMPQHYQFTPGRSYIVFAKRTGDKGVFRQLWRYHKIKEDQGVLLAADEKPHTGADLKDVFWAELTGLLKSPKTDDVRYAIAQLDQMSGGRIEPGHFERAYALKPIAALVAHKDERVAAEAIRAVGSRNPYLSDGFAPGWLATIGCGHIPGFAKWKPESQNPGAATYWKELTAVAEGKAPAKVRALAVRALGRAGRPQLFDYVKRWMEDPQPPVRQAAAILLADFPGQDSARLVAACAGDPSGEVRFGAARAIGFGQFAQSVPLLAELLKDKDQKVRDAAALSLLSFAPAHAEQVLKANVENRQYRSVFVNALAAEKPGEYLNALVEIIEKRLEPTNFWGGRRPDAVSWEILFLYVQARPHDEVVCGKYDRCLDGLEKLNWFGSSEPRDLYALYLQRGMKLRAEKFRVRCKKTFRYDIGRYFDQVDQNPSLYQRR